MKSMRTQGGFTLLELLLVLMLIGIAMGLSSVMVIGQTLPSARFNATARELSATIREARTLARLNGERQILIINLDSRTYGIEGRRTRAVPGDTGILIRDAFAGEIHRGEYRILFNPSGAAESGTIVLWTGKKSVSIQTDPIVGSVAFRQ
jgi:general secretion pathway protein H